MRRLGILLSIVWIVVAAAGYRYTVVSGASQEQTERDAQALSDSQACQKATPGQQCTDDFNDFKKTSAEIYGDQTAWDRSAITNLALLILVPLALAWLVGWVVLKIVRRFRGSPRAV